MSEPKHSVDVVAKALCGHGISWELACWLAELDRRVWELQEKNRRVCGVLPLGEEPDDER